MLARLAHFVARHRWSRHRRLDRAHALRRLRRRPGLEALVPELLDPGQVRLRGEPAHAEGVRRRRPPAERRRLPHGGRRDEERRDPGGDAARGDGEPRRADELVLLDAATPMYVSKDRHTTFMEIYPAGSPKFDTKSGAGADRAAAAAAGLPAGISVAGDRARSARGGSTHGSSGGPSVLLEAVIGGARRARHPAVRLRDAAGGADADRRRDRVDPQHVHADLDPDLHHERLDHRPVPDRARRARRRDRLRAVDDLPLPRRAARGRGRRDGARRDDDARRTLGDRLRLDRGGRPAVARDPAAAVHPLDRHRRHADPGRLGDRRDHAAAGAARGARRSASTACA